MDVYANNFTDDSLGSFSMSAGWKRRKEFASMTTQELFLTA
jgi:hypothetical protein